MNQQLSPTQLVEMNTATMSKREKLFRLARLIRDYGRGLFIFNGLEHMTSRDRNLAGHPDSAFAVAAKDPILKDAGLTGPTVGEATKFFGLSNDELHAFSCDCGGALSNEQMARRIEVIATAA